MVQIYRFLFASMSNFQNFNTSSCGLEGHQLRFPAQVGLLQSWQPFGFSFSKSKNSSQPPKRGAPGKTALLFVVVYLCIGIFDAFSSSFFPSFGPFFCSGLPDLWSNKSGQAFPITAKPLPLPSIKSWEPKGTPPVPPPPENKALLRDY